MLLGNLLVICNDFPDKFAKYIVNIFVKEQLSYLRNYFENVYVVSPVPIGLEYLRKIHYVNYHFDNVHVYFIKYVDFPLFYFYSRNFWTYFEKTALINFLLKQDIKFDIIHAHNTWPSGAVATEIKKEFNVPVIITEHTSSMFSKAINKKDQQFIRTWKECDAIIRVRNDIHKFKDVGISLDKIYYVPNGYDNKKFIKLDKKMCREKLKLPQDRKIILTVGNLVEVKGHKYLIEAMQKIITYRKDILCIIVGSGKLKNTLKNQIEKLELKKNYVTLVGGKPHNEIPIWMNACDVFVLPSLRESFGVVQIEAMACGKPVVATYNGGSEDVITSEDYGFLAEPANSKELAEKILIALDKEWDSEKILEYAGRFRWEDIVEEILKVYEGVLK
ncbi:MAG: glycosyltransferase family 4 protein [Halobacteriota archaeon]